MSTRRPPPAAALLRDWLESEQLTQAGLAERLEVSAPTIWAWLGGVRVPGLEVAAVLEGLAGVPAASWADPTSVKRRVARAKKK